MPETIEEMRARLKGARDDMKRIQRREWKILHALEAAERNKVADIAAAEAAGEGRAKGLAGEALEQHKTAAREAALAKVRADAIAAADVEWAQDRAALTEDHKLRADGMTDEEEISRRKQAVRDAVAAA